MKFRRRGTGTRTTLPKIQNPYTIYLCCDCCPPNAHPAHMAPCGGHEPISAEYQPELLTEAAFWEEFNE